MVSLLCGVCFVLYGLAGVFVPGSGWPALQVGAGLIVLGLLYGAAGVHQLTSSPKESQPIM